MQHGLQSTSARDGQNCWSCIWYHGQRRSTRVTLVRSHGPRDGWMQSDRFAREIVPFLTPSLAALAAADAQLVGRLSFCRRVSFLNVVVWGCGTRPPCCWDGTKSSVG